MSRNKKRQHRQIDPVFKQVLSDEMTAFGATLQTQVEVSRLPRTIDALLTIHSAEDRQRICAETPFFYFLQTNQIEFKGRQDRLTVGGYHLIQGRMHLLLGEQKLSPQAMTVTIVCAGKPRTLLTYAAETLEQPFASLETGYYKCAGQPAVYLIVVDELPIVSKNYGLLLFAASEDKFREFLEQVVATGNMTYVRYAYEIRPQLTKEVLIMAGIASSISRKDLKFMAEDIGPQLVPFMKPEDVVKGMDRKKQLRLFKTTLAELAEEIGLEKLLAELNPEMQKQFAELVLQMQVAKSADDKEKDNVGGADKA
ncbi:MAG: hypothetical protein ACOYNY_07120 [Caldilineaceae bacterium]